MKKTELEFFVKKHFPDNCNFLMERFTSYYNWISEENKKINLISRKTDPDDYWTLHFLDSLLSTQCIDYNNKKILDFGTGGGFPGIPLAIIYQNSHFTLLDSTKKKIQSVKSGAANLGLSNCDFLDIRIEDMPKKSLGTFDIVVSRSVRIEPVYKKIILNLLKNDGRIVLYKSQNLEDAELFKNPEIFDVSSDLIGERKIIVIKKANQV